jgi:glucosylglycerate synthase
MAITDPIPGVTATPARRGAEILVLLSAMPAEQLESVLSKLIRSFLTEDLILAVPDGLLTEAYPALRIVAAPATSASWMLTAADFLNAYQLAEKNQAQAILMLGPESNSLSSSALRDLGDAALDRHADLAVPRFDLSPHAGLITSGILYPLTRTLFASGVRFPLVLDLGLSLRMAERLAGVASHFTPLNQSEALLWPVNEATVAGFTTCQVDAGPRTQTQPTGADLNTVLPLIVGSLFSDIEAKAAFWQRARQLPPALNLVPMAQAPSADASAEIAPLLQAFQLAYTNLEEIWRLVLPPSSLLGLKRLSATNGAAFLMPDNLWVRIVYDFLLAYRLRTINRGHLLGALIPLYLAWVASHINVVASGTDAEYHIEAVAAAFEADKTYLVSRWRWPDRFNP